jgi:hypothetical protein
MYSGAVPGELAFTSMAGGRRSGRVRYVLARPGPSDEAEPRVRGDCPQPNVPVNAISAAPAESAPRNLRRVILPPSPSFLAHVRAKSVLSSA